MEFMHGSCVGINPEQMGNHQFASVNMINFPSLQVKEEYSDWMDDNVFASEDETGEAGEGENEDRGDDGRVPKTPRRDIALCVEKSDQLVFVDENEIDVVKTVSEIGYYIVVFRYKPDNTHYILCSVDNATQTLVSDVLCIVYLMKKVYEGTEEGYMGSEFTDLINVPTPGSPGVAPSPGASQETVTPTATEQTTTTTATEQTATAAEEDPKVKAIFFHFNAPSLQDAENMISERGPEYKLISQTELGNYLYHYVEQ